MPNENTAAQTTDADVLHDTKDEPARELANGEVEVELTEGDVPLPGGESVDEELDDAAEGDEAGDEGAEEDKKADPKEPADQSDERRSRLLDRIEKWGDAPQPKAEKKDEPKEEPQPKEGELSEKAKKTWDALVERYGEEDAKVFRPMLEDLDNSKSLSQKQAKTIERLEREQQERATANVLEATNTIGKDVAAIAARGYEQALGKVGQYDPRTDRFMDSTEAQNQNISKLVQKANQYLAKSVAAGDPLSRNDAYELALMRLEKDDPAFKAVVKTEKVLEKRTRQLSHPPTRRSPTAAAGAGEDPYAKAKAAARSYYAKTRNFGDTE
jgi:hypothetical protein